LGEFPHARQVALVLQELALDHSNRPQVAQCATLALGRFEHPEVVPTLISVLENGDWQAFDFAALALAGRVARDFRRDSVRPAEVSRIRTALREATKLNQYTKGIVLALARDPGIGRDISKLSRRRFGSRLHQFQSEVAEILGERRPEIMQILEDQFRTIPGTDLTVASVRAFASLGAIDFNKRLRDPFLESYDYDSIRAPLDAAGYTADPIAVPFLIDVLLDSKRSCGQRTAAADALGRIGDVRLMDPFVRLRLRSPFPVGFLGFDEPAWN
jgi:HEAT repeat protein